jgi:hypothetical protein
MTSATASKLAVAPLTTPETGRPALAEARSAFALVGLAPDNQQRTTPTCAEREDTIGAKIGRVNHHGTNGFIDGMSGYFLLLITVYKHVVISVVTGNQFLGRHWLRPRSSCCAPTWK